MKNRDLPPEPVHVDRLALDASGVPSVLTDAEREVWRVCVAALPTSKRTPDRLPLLIAYCRAAARADHFEGLLAKSGPDDQEYGWKLNATQQAAMAMARLARACGMSAQDQPRKRGRPPKQKNPTEKT
jgi:hypothetical protein